MKPTEEYLGLRDLLYAEAPRESLGVEPKEVVARQQVESRLLLNAWFLLRQAGQKPGAGDDKRVLGVMLEEGRGGGCYTVAGFADGSARFFASGGFGIIGETMPEPIRRAAQKLVESGRALLEAPDGLEGLAEETHHPLPEPGLCRLVFMTPGGTRVALGKSGEFEARGNRYYPVYLEVNNLITEFRLFSESREKKKEK